MITHQSTASTYVNPITRRDSVVIKFGKVHYRIQYDQIAYLYKAEGIFFLVDKKQLKLPLFMNSLEDFPLPLGEDQFFHVSDRLVVSRGSVELQPLLDTIYLFAFNARFRNKFILPKFKLTQFQNWLQSSK